MKRCVTSWTYDYRHGVVGLVIAVALTILALTSRTGDAATTLTIATAVAAGSGWVPRKQSTR